LWRHEFVERVRLSPPFEPEVVSALSSLGNLKDLELSASVEPVVKNRFSVVPSIAKRLPNRKREIHPQIAPPSGSIGKVLGGQKLRSFQLSGFALADADYAAIGKQATLDSVVLETMNIPEKALPTLLSLPGLRSFEMNACEVTGSALGTTPGSTRLESVHCGGTPVGVVFAAFLSRCPKVKTLNLGHVAVDDDFVKALGPHPGIRYLFLSSTSVTDGCIPSIQLFASIEFVTLPDRITDEGRRCLKTAMQGVDLRFN
jgi:hypothetical protein